MADRPILFSGPLVRAILAGRKTETRRLVAEQTSKVSDADGKQASWPGLRTASCSSKIFLAGGKLFIAPRIEVSDRLWVRETWRTFPGWDDSAASNIPNDVGIHYDADGEPDLSWGKIRASIHMPRWAARLFLRVTEVRAERLQSITNDGAKAEGIADRPTLEQVQAYPKGTAELRVFRSLWDSIYGDKPGASWGSDPWVWVIKFEREDPT